MFWQVTVHVKGRNGDNGVGLAPASGAHFVEGGGGEWVQDKGRVGKGGLEGLLGSACRQNGFVAPEVGLSSGSPGWSPFRTVPGGKTAVSNEMLCDIPQDADSHFCYQLMVIS